VLQTRQSGSERVDSDGRIDEYNGNAIERDT
jgi:hypothetical protein